MTPTPSPTPSAPTFDPNLVTPGVIGFAVTALLAVAVIFLVLDMTRRIRRVQYRQEARAKIAEEQAANERQAPPQP